MVTGEFYTKKDLFPGFGRPFVFYAEILKKFVEIFSEHFHVFQVLHFFISQSNLFNYFLFRVGRTSEAKDAARVALKSPWWTLGCAYQVLTLLQLELIIF
jgi:hypothetical protein